MAHTSIKDLPPDQREEAHRSAEGRIATFSFATPEPSGRAKQFTTLAKSDLLNVFVQTIRDGGENNLHYHTDVDQCYFVLKGRLRFHGVNGVLGEFGPSEGIVLPLGTRYWFEKISREDVDVLHMMGRDKSMAGQTGRINIEPHKARMTEAFLQVYEDNKA